MRDGLKDAHRDAIIAAIAANDRVERAVLFGSRATGTNTVSSDVDIALFGDRLTLTDQARLATALDEIPMAQSVDLLLYDSIRAATLREHIRTRGVEWHARPRHREIAVTAGRREIESEPVTLVESDKSSEPMRWRTDRWGELVTLEYGRALRDYETGQGAFRVYGTNGPIGWHDEALSEGPTVVVGRKGAYRGVHYSPDPCFVIDTAFYVKPKRDIDVRWAYYTLLMADINGMDSGSAIPSTSRSDFYGLSVSVPPRFEQRAIAHVLGTLNDKIELNHRMNATLEAMARALFKSWFVDFDPVRSKVAGRDTGLPTEIAELFPDRLMGSVLGEIPMGWDIGTLAQHLKVAKGVSYKGRGLGRDGIPLHNLNSVHEGGGYKYEGIKYYTGDHADRHVVRPGDVIIANTEQGHDRLLIGYAAIVPSFFGEYGICSHHLYRLRPRRNGQLTTRFLQQLLNSPMMHDIVSGYANGTTVNMLPVDAVQMPMLAVPPRTLIDRYDAIASEIEHRREQIVGESRTLEVIRDRLLPKLVSGALSVDAVVAE